MPRLPELLAKTRERVLLPIVSRYIPQTSGERGEGLFVHAAAEFLDAVSGPLGELLVVPRTVGDADHRDVEAASLHQPVERQRPECAHQSSR